MFSFLRSKILLELILLITIISIVITSLGYAQTERWVYTYNGSADSTDEAHSIVYGGDGNIYAAGYSHGSGTGKDFTIISLTTTGDTNWIYRYNGTTNGDDEAKAIIYGSNGTIYAAGYSGSGTNKDILVISLTTGGDTNWVYKYDGPMHVYDEAYDLIYGLNDKVYVAGYSVGLGTSQDFTVISLTPSGSQRWVYTLGTIYGDYAYSIDYGLDGNIYAAGTRDGISSSYDFIIISLDTTGSQRWMYTYNGSGNDWDCAHSIVCGSDTNVYAAGYSRGSSTNDDFTVVSVDTAGDERWVHNYNGPGNAGDHAYSIDYGLDNQIYAAGFTTGNGTYGDFTVINLTDTGDTNWSYCYDGPISNLDGAEDVVYGLDGNIYAAGYSWGITNAASDFIITSITVSGNERWVYRYNGPGYSDDHANALVYGSDGYIYAAGRCRPSGTYSDFAVISLDPAIGVEEYQFSQIPGFDFELLSSFFNKSITVRFANSSTLPLKISVYNIVGALVYETSLSSTPSYLCLNDKSIARLSKGVYFLSILQNKRVKLVTKIIKI
jgi:uncharacterized delta-60 repeat protein